MNEIYFNTGTGLILATGTDAARLGMRPAMSDVVQDTGGGDKVLFWALAIGGLLWSLSTGKRTIRVF